MENARSRPYDALVIVLMLVSGIVRFYRFPERIGWWGDIARDFIVGYHIAIYKEFPVIGHNASGLVNYFFYPPYYYYFIGLLTYIFRTPVLITGFFTLIHIVSIYILYQIGKNLYNSKVGLVSAILLTFSTSSVRSSTDSLSAHNALFPFLLGTFFYIKFFVSGRNRFGLVFLSFLLLAWASSINYSVFVIIPFYFICGFILLRKNLIEFLKISILFVGIFVVWYIPLLTTFGASSIANTFSPINNISIRTNVLFTIYRIAGMFWKEQFILHGDLAGISLIPIIIVSTYVIMKQPRKMVAVFPLLTLVGLVILIASLKKGEIYPHFLYLVYPILYISIAYLFVVAWEISRKYQKIIIVALCSFFVVLLATGFRYIVEAREDYDLTEKLVDTILQEEIYTNNKNYYRTMVTVAIPESSSWESFTAWYFLETKLRTRLVTISRYGPVLTTDVDYWVLICKDNMFRRQYLEKDCPEQYKKTHLDYVLINMPFSPVSKYRLYWWKKGSV